MAPNPAPKVCPDTKGMVFTHYCITIAIFSENALLSKNAFQVKNIARGTTDPEIDSETWTKLCNNMAPLALIANLATRWRHLTFSHKITFSH